MSISAFHPEDIVSVADTWNAFWSAAPRAFTATPSDWAARVLKSPVLPATQILTLKRNGEVQGFVHFGPREDWWFTLQKRPSPDAKTGTIYALCAANEQDFNSLAKVAEAELQSAGATVVNLWPTWAQGAVPFYNGLTPSHEVSGLWSNHPSRKWAERYGYASLSTYQLGVLSLPILCRSTAAGSRAMWDDFPSPILPYAKRLSLRTANTSEEIGWVVAAPSWERNAAEGSKEWAAFDVAIRETWRGQGWGRVLMQHAARLTAKEGARSLQIHVVQGNTAAEALYFRSMGFRQVPSGIFVTLRKELGRGKDE